MGEKVGNPGLEIFLIEGIFHFFGGCDFDDGKEGSMLVFSDGEIMVPTANHLDDFLFLGGNGYFNTLPFRSGQFLLREIHCYYGLGGYF